MSKVTEPMLLDKTGQQLLGAMTKQGEYEMEIENTDKVETGIWKWNDDGYIILYQDDKVVANLVYMNGEYLFFDADVKIQKLKRISETAIVK